MTESKQLAQTAAALGVFDGMHLGHRSVLAAAMAQGSCHVVSFAAVSMLQKQGRRLSYLYDDPQKIRLATECGAKAVTLLDFSAVRNYDGERFCREILCEQIGASVVVCGSGFRFGKDAAYTAEDLMRYGKQMGFAVQLVPEVSDAAGEAISSRRIRSLLETGDITTANALLGTDYRIEQMVESGNQIGRTIGFPTANQPFAPWRCIPKYGVYASISHWEGRQIPSITNIGTRPTVTGGDAVPTAETHLLDWNGQLVGHWLCVTLSAFLRPEQPFPSLDALTAQIRQDTERRRQMG